ncbi:MAG: hypothetical protein AAFN70_18910, partial [Planctomycetota bacterium]
LWQMAEGRRRIEWDQTSRVLSALTGQPHAKYHPLSQHAGGVALTPDNLSAIHDALEARSRN